MSTTSSSSVTSVTRSILIGIALVAVAILLWQVADALVIAFGGVVCATVLRVLMEPLIRVTGWRDRWALLIVVLGLTVIFGLLFWLFGKQASDQFAEMRDRLPAAIDKFKLWMSNSRLGQVALELLKPSGEATMPSGAASGLGAALGGIGNFLLIVFIGIYLAAAPRLYRDGALRLLPPNRRAQVGRALDKAGEALRKWLVAQIIVMAAVGVMMGVGLAILQVPLSLSLGLLTGLCEFVPVVGPIVATVPAALLAFSQGPQTAIYVLGLAVVVQQVESNVLTPLIQRWAVELPPAIALLSIVVGGLLFGVMGVIFATPMAVVVMVLVEHIYVKGTLESGEGPAHRTRPPAARSA